MFLRIICKNKKLQIIILSEIKCRQIDWFTGRYYYVVLLKNSKIAYTLCTECMQWLAEASSWFEIGGSCVRFWKLGVVGSKSSIDRGTLHRIEGIISGIFYLLCTNLTIYVKSPLWKVLSSQIRIFLYIIGYRPNNRLFHGGPTTFTTHPDQNGGSLSSNPQNWRLRWLVTFYPSFSSACLSIKIINAKVPRLHKVRKTHGIG